MGAYYEATFKREDGNSVRFDTHRTGNGLKLMEHSYLKNSYCKAIMSMIHENAESLVWLCDYHEEDGNTDLTWDKTSNTNYHFEDVFGDNPYYIVNETKGMFIHTGELEKLYKEEDPEDPWMIHPIPILCNSEDCSVGGGDFHPDDSRRAEWCEDMIFTTLEHPGDSYLDVTTDCLFFER